MPISRSRQRAKTLDFSVLRVCCENTTSRKNAVICGNLPPKLFFGRRTQTLTYSFLSTDPSARRLTVFPFEIRRSRQRSTIQFESSPTKWKTAMTCTEVTKKIEARMPGAEPIEIARMCTLMCGHVSDLSQFDNEIYFDSVWDEVTLRLHAASDQHAAMTQELEDLTNSDPRKFTPDQIWILVRAIKVQSQVLRMYQGDSHTELV